MSLRWLVLTIPLTGPLVAGGAISPAAPGATPASPSGTFAEMLRTIPDDVLSADGSMITFTDTELMWERVEVGDDPTERATFEPLRSLPVVILPDVMNRDGLTDGDALRDEIGFDGYDIQRALTAGAPPSEYEIIDIAVPGQSVEDAIHADPVRSPDLQELATDAGRFFQWTDDPGSIDTTRRSTFRPFGQGGTLAMIEDDPARLVRSYDAADIEAALRAGEDGEPSVAGDQFIAPVLEALDGRAVTQAIVQPRPTLLDVIAPLVTPGTVPTDLDELETQVSALEAGAIPIDGYLGIVIAEVLEGDSVQTELFVIHLNGEDATANVDRINEHISSAVLTSGLPAADAFGGAEVVADGNIVRLLLPGEDAFSTMFKLLNQRALLPM